MHWAWAFSVGSRGVRPLNEAPSHPELLETICKDEI